MPKRLDILGTLSHGSRLNKRSFRSDFVYLPFYFYFWQTYGKELNPKICSCSDGYTAYLPLPKIN
jgi:hypothetical protein